MIMCSACIESCHVALQIYRVDNDDDLWMYIKTECKQFLSFFFTLFLFLQANNIVSFYWLSMNLRDILAKLQ